MKHRLYYNIQNGGDGSVSLELFESKELANWDEDHMSEGWGEPSVSWLDIESDGPINVDGTTTKEGYLIEQYIDSSWAEENCQHKEEFIKKFFPDGVPVFTCKVGESNLASDFCNYYIYVGDRRVAKLFHRKGIKEEILKDINE